MAQLAITVTGTMTLGDLIVGLGTLALAGFMYCPTARSLDRA
jgi:hypothetical protein